MLPDFVIAGVQKAGTTHLYSVLDAHPDVCMSVEKEIHFFDREDNFARGTGWYARHFDRCGGDRLVGEATPHYYRFPEVPRRMAEVLPDVRLLFLLRDPVHRAYSNYWFNVGRGVEPRGFLEALETPDGYKRYVKKGLYVRHLKRFFDFFDRGNVLVLLLEDLRGGSGRGWSELEDFLGLEPASLASIHRRMQETNVTRVPTRPWGRWLLRLYSRFHAWIPEPVKHWTSGARSVLRNLVTEPDYPPLDPAVDRYLRHVYLPYNRRLERLLDRDLQAWYS